MKNQIKAGVIRASLEMLSDIELIKELNKNPSNTRLTGEHYRRSLRKRARRRVKPIHIKTL